jgi:hypothetical protein
LLLLLSKELYNKPDLLNLFYFWACMRIEAVLPEGNVSFNILLADSASSGFGGLGVSVLASGTQVCGFIPGRSRRIFKGGKILSTPSFRREVKPWVPCRKICGM